MDGSNTEHPRVRHLTSSLAIVLSLQASLAFTESVTAHEPQTSTVTQSPGHSPPETDDASATTSPFGFACDNQTTYTLRGYCPQMAQAGLNWIRGFPTFNVIEPARGRFDWSAVDEFLSVAAQNRIQVSGLFFYNAAWIKPSDTLPTGD